jgi:hypothetical protein
MLAHHSEQIKYLKCNVNTKGIILKPDYTLAIIVVKITEIRWSVLRNNAVFIKQQQIKCKYDGAECP